MDTMDLVGRYRVERRIGAGAFSTVWLAHDDALQIPVAIKLLSDNWIDHAEVRSRFLDEARLLRRISDPGIVGVHDIGRLPDGRDYFVMDYADGGTVADHCRQPMPPAIALRLGADIARAVGRLHEYGVLHRDLKPANVLLSTTDSGLQPVLADLGTAKRLAEASGLTVAAGTPAYMAPEQAKGLGLDERTDVYGVAAVCYRLVVGEVPYPEESLTEIANRPLDRHPVFPFATETLPTGLTVLLRDALSTDPERRPASAAALAAELEALADLSPSPTPSPGTRSPSTPSTSSPTATRPSTEPTPTAAGYRPTELRYAGSADPRSAVTVASAQREDRSAGPRSPALRIVGAAGLAVLVAVATWLLLSLVLNH